MGDIFYSTGRGLLTAGLFGGVAAVLAGVVTSLFAGPALLAAGIAGGLFGLFGAAGAAIDAGTSGRGDWRGAWLGGLPVAAALSFGLPAIESLSWEQPLPEKDAVTQSFNAAGTLLPSAASTVLANNDTKLKKGEKNYGL